MALTIGVRTYASNADLRQLCGDPQFTEALRAELSHIGNDAQRQQALAGAMAKLKKWVTHDAKSLPAEIRGPSIPPLHRPRLEGPR